jgi:hypothetical protein
MYIRGYLQPALVWSQPKSSSRKRCSLEIKEVIAFFSTEDLDQSVYIIEFEQDRPRWMSGTVEFEHLLNGYTDWYAEIMAQQMILIMTRFINSS